MNQKIFKAYDIRGVYPEEINEEAVHEIGAVFVFLFVLFYLLR
jgi:phosphomannomutase